MTQLLLGTHASHVGFVAIFNNNSIMCSLIRFSLPNSLCAYSSQSSFLDNSESVLFLAKKKEPALCVQVTVFWRGLVSCSFDHRASVYFSSSSFVQNEFVKINKFTVLKRDDHVRFNCLVDRYQSSVVSACSTRC